MIKYSIWPSSHFCYIVLVQFWLPNMIFCLILWILYFCLVNNQTRNLNNLYSEKIVHAFWHRIFFVIILGIWSETDWPWTTLWETIICKTIISYCILVMHPKDLAIYCKFLLILLIFKKILSQLLQFFLTLCMCVLIFLKL